MSKEPSLLMTNPSWQFAEEVKKICEPFFEKFDIHYVDYARYFSDGRIIGLYTDRNYANHFLGQDAYLKFPPNQILTQGFHLWDEYINPTFLKNISSQFQYGHGLTILNEMKDHKEIFNLATHPHNNSILNLYLNQQPLINRFIEYFRKRTADMLKILENKPLIILPHKVSAQYSTTTNRFEKSARELAEMLTQNTPLSIHVNHISITLTKREAQCLYLLNQGKTSKQIAKTLLVSPRTVETYLMQLRDKTGSKNRIELLSKVSRVDLNSLEFSMEQ